jgi:hypothetical protein
LLQTGHHRFLEDSIHFYDSMIVFEKRRIREPITEVR